MSQRTAPVSSQPTQLSDYVLPGRPKAQAPVLVTGATPSPRWLEHERATVVRDLGERFLGLAESQRQLLGELREALVQCDQAVADAPRARLKGAVQQALAVLSWCEATGEDCAQQARAAVAGWRPVDLLAAGREAAAAQPGIAVQVVGSGCWWGDGERLQVCLAAGLRLVAERSAGPGGLLVEVAADADGATVRLCSAGEPVGDLDPGTVAAFRSAAENLGAQVLPDQLGPAASGLILRLPPV
jgi:hypothetical protein